MGVGDFLKRVGTGAVRTISDFGQKAVGKRESNDYVDYTAQAPRKITMEELEERKRNAQIAQEAIRRARANIRAERFAKVKSNVLDVARDVRSIPSGLSSYGAGKGGQGQRFALAGARTRSGRYSAGRAGRPKGPSGRYIIPGVGPVGVYQYRDWMKRQRALVRQQREQQMMNPQQQLRQARDYPAYPQQQYQQVPQQYIPQQRELPQPTQQLPLPARPSMLGRLNLWDSGFSMTGGDLNLMTPFEQSQEGTGKLGLFTPFGGGIL